MRVIFPADYQKTNAKIRGLLGFLTLELRVVGLKRTGLKCSLVLWEQCCLLGIEEYARQICLEFLLLTQQLMLSWGLLFSMQIIFVFKCRGVLYWLISLFCNNLINILVALEDEICLVALICWLFDLLSWLLLNGKPMKQMIRTAPAVENFQIILRSLRLELSSCWLWGAANVIV